MGSGIIKGDLGLDLIGLYCVRLLIFFEFNSFGGLYVLLIFLASIDSPTNPPAFDYLHCF